MISISSFFATGAATRLTAVLSGAGVILGALGAHAWKPMLSARPDGVDNWRTAVLYHLIHAAVMLVISYQGGRANRFAWWCFLIGVLGFSGSLYLLVGQGWKFLGPVTPLGGLFLLLGWTALAVRPFGKKL